ncbi:hypothetical protein RHMOL_Rhmol11G0163600 [Rhododendron molle]|uniref:Uncharacterized protein n=1 Tax=Rhododendron molle TaxID=49168 RepID=A0ACC0LSP2_RHOML|nr:hypothetical protein RHMOL_Rhmol11G0163600 [Rhododendron molle]
MQGIGEGGDEMRWNLSKSGCFQVKSFYQALGGYRNASFPRQAIWKTVAPLRRDAETVDNFLIHCPVAWELWSMVFSWFGLKWAMLRNVMELLIVWNGARVGKRGNRVWAMIPLCLMWII